VPVDPAIRTTHSCHRIVKCVLLTDIPIYLATGGEAMVKLTTEIADGWLPMGFVPGAMGPDPRRALWPAVM
jgi:alkanesulfonate monooxygenase SsuD/methylene tetrahydromethanopterin reductase-like flavin-dependent oxidoreductase (luciferase family)